MCRCDCWLRFRRVFGLPYGRVSIFETQAAPGKAGGCLLIPVLICVFAGCQQEMANQPRYEPLEPNPVVIEKLMARTPTPGTVARGELQLDAAYFTGKVNGQFVSELPQAALAGRSLQELLARGRERYTIFCSHCHGQMGGGIGGDPQYERLAGMVVQRGYPAPPTYHQQRLRQAPLGHFYDVITNGLGRMPPHGYLVLPEDRWAIAAYIRVLQLSQSAPRDELTPEDLEKLATPPAAESSQQANYTPLR